jgi:hypothetical protein
MVIRRKERRGKGGGGPVREKLSPGCGIDTGNGVPVIFSSDSYIPFMLTQKAPGVILWEIDSSF